MADDVYTTLLNFVTESNEANREIKATTKNLKEMEVQAEKVSNVDLGKGIAFPGDELSKDFDSFTSAFDKTFKRVKDNIVDLRTGTKAVSADLRKFSATSAEDLKKINLGGINIENIKEAAKKAGQEISNELAAGLASGNLTDADFIEIQAIEKQIEEIHKMEEAREQELKGAIAASRQKASLYNREAQILNKMSEDIKQNAGILRNQAQQLQGVSQLALGAGVGIVGGIFAAANKYVKDAKEATAVTIEWKAAQESLAKSGQRVGAVLAQEALPLLRIAAETAAKAAGFVEKHPQLIQAAINIGLITAGLGAVGLAVSKGIKLYADQLYLSSIPLQLEAGRLQFAAAQEQLLAARIKAGKDVTGGTLPPSAPKGGSVLQSIVPAIALGAASIGTSKVLADQFNQLGVKMAVVTKNVPLVNLLFTSIQNGLAPLLPFIGPIRQLQQHLPGVNKLLEQLGLKSKEVSEEAPVTGVQASAGFEQILRAYEDYKKDDLALVQRHYADRENIISSALKAEQTENARYTADANRIRTQSGRAISQATAAFHEQDAQAERQYLDNRAQIARDGGIEIERIEGQLQENLRKLRLDHEDRIQELTNNLDALGLVKEQERYERERSEQTRETNIEIRQRRADLAIRLSDVQASFEAERAQRFEDYKARIAEIQANTAEQLKELAARHQEELTQIRQQRAERIKELDNQFKEERKRRYDYFVDQIRNLDAGLIGEAELRKRRQAELITELDRFLLQYNQRAGSIAQASALSATRAKGGYAAYGTYLLGDRQGGGPGKREYVLSGDTTELAERVLGGQLSQNKLASLLSAMNGGGSKNVVYNDERRFDSKISSADREGILDDTFQALELSLR